MLFDAHSDEVTKWTKVIEIEEKKIQVTFDATFSAWQAAKELPRKPLRFSLQLFALYIC